MLKEIAEPDDQHFKMPSKVPPLPPAPVMKKRKAQDTDEAKCQEEATISADANALDKQQKMAANNASSMKGLMV